MIVFRNGIDPQGGTLKCRGISRCDKVTESLFLNNFSISNINNQCLQTVSNERGPKSGGHL